MIPATFEYRRAKSVGAVLKALAETDGVKVIAGGQTLLPLMRFRLARPALLIDIGRLERLKGVGTARGGVRIGAATTYHELMNAALLRERFPIIAEVCEQIGDRQVRNVGTIGGSIAHADPAADMPAVMLALDATFTLQSRANGKRTVPAREFFRGPFMTAIKDDELLTHITIPNLPRGRSCFAYESFEQQASGYALVGVAAVLVLARRTVKHAALAFTGLADSPFVAEAAGQLVGTKGEADVIATVASAAVAGVEANDDIHAPADYRKHLGTVAARRAIARAIERAG